MRKALKKFGREQEFWVHRNGFSAPVFAHIRPDMAVKRGIDLTAIDELRQIFQRMDLPFLQIGWLNNSFPVFVGKSGSADKDIHNFAISGCFAKKGKSDH
jgi:hypothetical protein